jgi:hypothetical protein
VFWFEPTLNETYPGMAKHHDGFVDPQRQTARQGQA